MPLMLEIAEDGGIHKKTWNDLNIREGLYLFNGALTNFYLSQRFNLKYTDLNLIIATSR